MIQIESNGNEIRKDLTTEVTSSIVQLVQEKDRDDFDINQEIENLYFQELSSFENSNNPVIERLISSNSSIARYRIVFLPECNVIDPIRSLYTDQEWSMMELNWEKVEKKMGNSFPSFVENLQLLLEKYNKAIIDATVGYYIDLNKVETTVSQSPFSDQHLYLFARDWPLRWMQQLYTAFLTCFQTPINPLNDGTASEGEIENIDRKKQLDLNRNTKKGRTNSGSWYHDAVLIMKVGNRDVQIAFGEVIGNAFKQDEKKLNEDREKLLKAMQLALFNLRKLFPQNSSGLEDLETFGLLVYSGICFVDQFNGFTMPDTPLQLGNLNEIIYIMNTFKHRVMKLQQHVESMRKSRKNFKRRGTRHDNDSIVFASPNNRNITD
ncbi:13221_t:CDS:2 [Entrophospora sp. SA101]|nr:13221_t:CDS:2 [Entrophospora sp. SA101]